MTLAEEVLAPSSGTFGIPVLATERLTLCAPRHEDAATIAALAADRAVAENTSRIPHPYRLADAERFIAAANKGAGEACFAIRFGDTLIGVCGIEPREDGPELGYWLGVAAWGRGFGTEAVRAVIDFAFENWHHETLLAGARISNPASRRILEKCGFQWTGVRLCRLRAIHSAGPVDRFRLDRKLWASLKSWGQVRRVA